MKEIERAIEFLENEIRYCEKVLGENLVSNDYRRITLQALQEKLDRQENKALELSELKEMIGEPVWCEVEVRDYKGWVLLKEINDKTLTDLGINFPYELARSISEVNTFAKYYKHKPNGGG